VTFTVECRTLAPDWCSPRTEFFYRSIDQYGILYRPGRSPPVLFELKALGSCQA